MGVTIYAHRNDRTLTAATRYSGYCIERRDWEILIASYIIPKGLVLLLLADIPELTSNKLSSMTKILVQILY
jgi:hypothetical protein